MSTANKKPDFIGLGTLKAGTTWIHACLYEHPQIYMPATKEIEFFNNHYSKGIRWYGNLFRGCASGQIAGEFTSSYLHDPDTPKRIRDYHPQVKLLICLRNPVERTVSEFRYAIQVGVFPPTRSFEEHVRKPHPSLEHGCYHTHIQRYLKYFNKDQMLIMIYEDIPKTPHLFMRDICQFLGVNSQLEFSRVTKQVNVTRGAPKLYSLDSLMGVVAKSLRKSGLEHIVWTLGRSRLVEVIRELNARPLEQSPLSEVLRAELQEFFGPDVRALADFLKRDLRDVWFDYEHPSRVLSLEN